MNGRARRNVHEFRYVAARIAVCAIIAIGAWQGLASAQEVSGARVFLLVVEDLRPEFVNQRMMPNLTRLAAIGVRLNQHRAVYPTNTVVQAVSIATGSNPSGHGNFVDVTLAEAQSLLHESPPPLTFIDAVTDAPFNFVQSRDDDVADAEKVSRFLERGVRTDFATSLWLSGPATAQREHGVGSREAQRAVRLTDEHIGRVVDHLESGAVNVFVVSLRGAMTTRMPAIDLQEQLAENGFDDEIRVVGRSIYVPDHDRPTITRIAQWFQRQPWAGAIYTQQARPTHPEGFVPGVLSFQAVYMDATSAPDILVEPAWSDAENEHGVAGTSYAFVGDETGTSSPYDLNTVFIAAGPDIKRGVESNVPSAHYDLAPTFCHLLGIDPAEEMDGRVLNEILREGPNPDSVEVLRRRQGAMAEWEGGHYRSLMHEATVDGVDYLEMIRVDASR